MKKTGNIEVEQESKFSLANSKEFMLEVKSEFGKIAWPDKKHTLASTGVVALFVIMISFFLGAVDLILGKLISTILN